ncbi:uncharacterized protein LOC131038131 [Cryptomeria japonica]|uniref:uncharacterized protein LOC131038131 n=1 Tax=Cryptomeria japonica TaxID=3369 RepID=UPI0027DAB14C|nr:uncharacterized protein LOC131038131 [Cryptomeria japonica]
MFPYSSLVVYTVVSVATSFLVTTSRVSIWIIGSLHTYVHPENVVNGDGGNVRAAIRRPEDNIDTNENASKLKERSKLNPSKGSKRKKDKPKEKTDFDETNAQIFRVRLAESQIQTRQYFAEYDEAVIYASLGLSNLLTYQFLPGCLSSDDKQASAMFFRGDLVPILVGSFAIYKLARFLGRVSSDRYTSKKSEKLLSIFVGVLGFLISLTILSVSAPGFVDLRVGVSSIAKSKDKDGSEMSFEFGFLKFLLACFSGWLCGLLFSPAHKAVRSFWLGTDQLQWNLSVIGSGKVTRVLFYLNIMMPVFTSLLWINPMADIFISESSQKQGFKNMKPRILPYDKNPRGLQPGTEYSDDLIGQNIEVDNTGMQDSGHQSEMRKCSETKEGFLSQCEHTFYQRQMSEISNSEKNLDPKSDMSDSGMFYNEGEDIKWYSWRASYSFHQENWAQQIGMSPASFEQFRIWCLLFTGVLQLLLVRSNLQMYLNEAVLIWYQRLHGSKVPNLDFSRAKLFLHNYFICQVALQFFIPGSLVLLFVGLSRTKSIDIGPNLPGSFLVSSTFVQEAAIFMAWWMQSVWAALTCLNLALYRLGFLMVS